MIPSTLNLFIFGICCTIGSMRVEAMRIRNPGPIAALRERYLREANKENASHVTKVVKTGQVANMRKLFQHGVEERDMHTSEPIKVNEVSKANSMTFNPEVVEVVERVDVNEADARVIESWGLARASDWTQLRCVGLSRCVFKVQQGEKTVVLKRVSLESSSDALEFARETATMELLDGKHNTLQLIHKVAIGQWGYMLLPLVSHPDLLAYVQAALYLGWSEDSIWQIFGKAAATEVSSAVFHLHRNGLGHGDLKLDNILIGELSVKDVADLPSTAKRSLPTWLQRDYKNNKGGIQDAVDDLSNGRVPAHFTLFDFGMSRPLEAKEEKRAKGVTEKEVDVHMWTMTLLQLRYTTDDLYRQMKTLNGRYFSGDVDSDAFHDLLSDLAEGNQIDMNAKLKSLALGTEAEETFGNILDRI
jgi:serine/threonine protein kinase